LSKPEQPSRIGATRFFRKVSIRLGSRLKDIFGKAGMEILEGLINGKNIEDIINQSQNKRLVE